MWISSPPWLWECFLVSPINASTSLIVIENSQVILELDKKVPGLWNKLEDERKGDKTFCRKRREEAFEENKKRLEDIQEKKSEKKREILQASVKKQIQLENLERQNIEREKKEENERITAELERIRGQQRKADEIALKRKNLQEMSKMLPPPRRSGHITVSFTPRVFPTAARESKEAEEKEWLEKQAATSETLKLDCEDLKPQERNPEWLKKKAESLFDKEDYLGAINAYNLAVRMCPSLYSLYLGRSACHLKFRNLHKCIKDSSKALELLIPPVPSNAKDRFESHKIRGMAFHKLDLPVEGLMDFEAALKIYPNDEELKLKAEMLRKLIQSADDEDYD